MECVASQLSAAKVGNSAASIEDEGLEVRGDRGTARVLDLAWQKVRLARRRAPLLAFALYDLHRHDRGGRAHGWTDTPL